MRRYLYLIGIAFSFFLVFIFSAWFAMRWVSSGRTVLVPDLKGKDIVRALKESGRVGLDLRVAGEEYDPVFSPKTVLRQLPPPGTRLKVDRNIEVVLSLGMRDVTIPEVRGMSLNKAEVVLKEEGLTIGRLTRAFFPGTEADTVLSQNPDPGTTHLKENRVDLLISRGGRPPVYRMPDLIGKDFDSVLALFETAGLEMGNVRYQEYEGVAENRIINQSPAFGYPVDRDHPVALVVSREGRMHSSAPIIRVRFRYRIPFGLLPVTADVFVNDRKGRRQVFSGRKFPETLLDLDLEIQGKAVVEVYLNGRKVQTREYR
ncbi:MAG: PASTA domain-containing protein [Deltaproteobacteria bacterium]|nr:PASTA domain-containing protein [Deltaproteobacteria bacterium]